MFLNCIFFFVLLQAFSYLSHFKMQQFLDFFLSVLKNKGVRKTAIKPPVRNINSYDFMTSTVFYSHVTIYECLKVLS